MTIISKIFYAGTDAFFSVFLLFIAPPIVWSDVIAFFLFGRALMTFVGASIPPYTMQSKIFYGGGDFLLGMFFLANAGTLGGPAGNIGTFLAIRATMTWVGIEL